MLHPAMTIRAATPSDADALSRLAALGNRRSPHGRALVAEREGVVIAAIALTNGSILADPANHPNDTAHMLRQCRYRIMRQGGDVGRVQWLLRRLAAPVQT
jgi:hypothetical protein